MGLHKGTYPIHFQLYNNSKKVPENWCRYCNRRLGNKKKKLDNICFWCKRKMYITNPNVSLNGKPYRRDDRGRPITLNTYVS